MMLECIDHKIKQGVMYLKQQKYTLQSSKVYNDVPTMNFVHPFIDTLVSWTTYWHDYSLNLCYLFRQLYYSILQAARLPVSLQVIQILLQFPDIHDHILQLFYMLLFEILGPFRVLSSFLVAW